MNFYTFLPKLLNMSLTASVAIVCVLLLRFLLKKAPKVISYALWAVVLFRLLCPASIASGFSLFGLMNAPTEDTSSRTSSIAYVPENIVHTEYSAVTLPIPDVSEAINNKLPQGKEQLVADPLEAPMSIATYVWMIGVLVMAVYSVVSYFRLRNKLLIASPLQDNIYLADEIATPFVMGLIRPKIYLPSDTEEGQQSYIILHEQHHIRRGDHIMKSLAFLALSIHWFNPLVWIAFVYAGKDMEMSCDEAVVKKLGADILADYTASLLSLATGRTIIAGVPLAFGEGDTDGRIRNLANWKKPTLWIVLVAVVACVTLGIGLMTNPEKEDTPAHAVVAKWTYSPMMGATWHHAFHFDFGMNDYSHIEASCDNGMLWNLDVQGQSQDKALRFEQGVRLCWSPDIEGNWLRKTAKSAKISFTMFDGEEIVGKGVLDIVRTGKENGQSFYEARLTDTDVLTLLQEEGSFMTYVVGAKKNLLKDEDVEAGTETAEDYYSMVTSASAKEVEQFAAGIKEDVLSKDWKSLSQKLVYPIQIEGKTINSSVDFLELDIDDMLNQEFVDYIAAESCREMFFNYQGIMMGATGQIWIASVDNGSGQWELKVIALNGLIIPSTT